MAEKSIKRNAIKQKEKIIDLTEDVISDKVIEKKRLWITCCGFQLTMKEQHSLVNGSELTDRIINAACAVLKNSLSSMVGCRQHYYNKPPEV